VGVGEDKKNNARIEGKGVKVGWWKKTWIHLNTKILSFKIMGIIVN